MLKSTGLRPLRLIALWIGDGGISRRGGMHADSGRDAASLKFPCPSLSSRNSDERCKAFAAARRCRTPWQARQVVHTASTCRSQKDVDRAIVVEICNYDVSGATGTITPRGVWVLGAEGHILREDSAAASLRRSA